MHHADAGQKPAGSYLGSAQRAACSAGTSIDHCLPTRSARCPVRDRRTDVLLGQRPSLHDLLRPSLAFVRPLRRYYAAVRLPAAVHVGLIAHRFHPPIRQSMTADGNRVLPRPLKGTVGSVLAREVSIHAWGLRLRSAGDHARVYACPVLPSGCFDTVGASDFSYFGAHQLQGYPDLHC